MKINDYNLSRVLLLKPYWADRILSHEKTWEIRSRKTSIRGRIGIIASGSGMISGETELIDCIKLTEELFETNHEKHQIAGKYKDLPENYQNGYIWVLDSEKSIKYEHPKNYTHPQGAVIWVDLTK